MAKRKDEPEMIQHRPVKEIIQNLLRELESHPEVRLGNCEIHGPCPSQLLVKGVPAGRQHFTQLRIAYNDPAPSAEDDAKKPWKWAGVVEEFNKQMPPPPDNPRPEWEGLLPPPPKKLEPAAV